MMATRLGLPAVIRDELSLKVIELLTGPPPVRIRLWID
jgi:hypothetical protein